MFNYKYGKEVESVLGVTDMLKDLSNTVVTLGKMAGRALSRHDKK